MHRFDPRLDQIAQRQWSLPDRPWVMTQSWHDLLFAHWRVDERLLRPLIPPRATPALPWLSAFAELNVRTYVSPRDGKRGVFFFSLDAERLPAVVTARALFRLPYFHARMDVTSRGDMVHYVSRRRRGEATFAATYAPGGPPVTPVKGSLEFFLTERYCLYHVDALGRPSRLEIHHAPWALQPAQAEIEINTMTAPLGIPLAGAPLLHFSKRQDVVAWLPRAIRT